MPPTRHRKNAIQLTRRHNLSVHMDVCVTCGSREGPIMWSAEIEGGSSLLCIKPIIDRMF